MSRPLTKVEKKVREYLAEIGRRGGVASRRELTRPQAKQMVAIREARRTAQKEGKTIDRKRLTIRREKKRSVRDQPAARKSGFPSSYARMPR